MWCIVGLGNPGQRYAGTRHNVGFDAADAVAADHDADWRRSWRFPLEAASWRDTHGLNWLVKHRRYMNRSGLALAPFMRRKGLALGDLIVLVDDIDLACGRIRIRRRGSAGGHNGLKSIIAACGGDDFIRVRIGVGGHAADRSRVEHVLSRFAPAERNLVDDAVQRVAVAVDCIRTQGVDRAMNEYNG